MEFRFAKLHYAAIRSFALAFLCCGGRRGFVMSDFGAKGIKTVIENYCPVVGHNVAVEVMRCGHTDLGSSCLRSRDCELEHGGCTNSIFGAAQASAPPSNHPPVL